MARKTKTIAAIDLGSNSFRILIKSYQESGEKWQDKTIVNDLRTVRLAENMRESGRLSHQAVERGLTACRLFAKHLAQHTPILTRICATEALRVATNSSDFIAAAQEILRNPIEILSPREEAELTLRGCMGGIVAKDKWPILLVDTGGASTELIFVNSSSRVPQICSLPIGALNITEKFIRHRPESAAELAALTSYLQQIIRPAFTSLVGNDPASCHNLQLLASGGTATAMAALDLNLRSYKAALIQGHQMTTPVIHKLLEDIRGLDLNTRNKLPGLASRGGIILTGIKIQQTIMEIAGLTTLMISATGLLAGILAQMASKVRKFSYL
ncbi:MAG: hypothetical protein GXP59_02435 [Deltaproteobacteria bacterium]|nr:hypothetical protein [Deltaproteobacteria bacterium]